MPDMRAFTSGGRHYAWSGGYGAVIKSFERGVKQGDTRLIEGHLFYAYRVYSAGWFRREVCWTFPKPTNEAIDAFRRQVFL